MRILTVSLCTLLLGIVLTVVVRAASRSVGLVAKPRDDRWHKTPTPMLGGAAIYFAFLTAFVVFAPKGANAYAILLGGSLLFVVGFIDDVVTIKPYAKLVAQLIAASIVVSFGMHLPWVEYQWINDVLTIFWLVGITNAINLLDNMDGLAGGVSVISCAFLTITFLLNGQSVEAVFPAILGSAVLGFLFFNFNPASIFMGDSGSMFLGFVLSATALLADTGRFRSLTSVLVTPVLILMIPIFDTCMVTITRRLSGRPISQGGRDHASHRLVALGVSERRAVVMLYSFAAISGTLALLVRVLETSLVLLLVPAFALGVIFVGLYLGKVRIYEDDQQATGFKLINAIANFSYKRRIFEVLLDVTLVALAYYGAYVLRWDGRLPDEQLGIFLKTLPLLIIIEMSAFLFGGVYKGLWHHAAIDDLLVIVKSVLSGAAVSALIVFGSYWFRGPSRAVFLLNLLLLLVFTTASRISFRLLRALIVGSGKTRAGAQPVLIYGAGEGGELLIREIMNNPDHRYAPVGFIDDDGRKAGKRMYGYRIFDSTELPNLIRAYGISEVLISSFKVPEAKLDRLRRMGVVLKKLSIRID